MKLRYLLAVVLGCILTLAGCQKSRSSLNPEAKSALSSLDKTLSRANRYRHQKMLYLDSLRRCIDETPKDDYGALYRANMVMCSALCPISGDSAYIFAQEAEKYAMKSGNPESMKLARLASLQSLVYAGYYLEAQKLYNALDTMQMSPNLKLDYWYSGLSLYINLGSYVPKNEFRRKYMEKAFVISDSLIQAIPHTNLEHRYLYAEQLYYASQYSRSRDIMEQVCQQAPSNGQLAAKANYILAMTCKVLDDNNGFVEHMARAAEINVKNVQYEGAYLALLADYLFNIGKLDEAYEYLTFAIKSASQGNGKMRSTSLASSLPTIDEAYKEELKRTETLFITIGVVSIVLLGICIFLMLYYYKRSQLLSSAQKQLANTSSLQETYMGRFIGLCSLYSEKLDKFSVLAQRKIASGQADDLLKLIKGGKVLEHNDDEYFYEVFDSAFLEIYPDFVGQINSLLRKDAQVELKNKNELTPELRIYALTRLGVDDSNRISQLLRYSPNTIYAYRNKMRNRAIDRDTFDADVKKIAKVSVPEEKYSFWKIFRRNKKRK